jgi:hypothetical protein
MTIIFLVTDLSPDLLVHKYPGAVVALGDYYDES